MFDNEDSEKREYKNREYFIFVSHQFLVKFAASVLRTLYVSFLISWYRIENDSVFIITNRVKNDPPRHFLLQVCWKIFIWIFSWKKNKIYRLTEQTMSRNIFSNPFSEWVKQPLCISFIHKKNNVLKFRFQTIKNWRTFRGIRFFFNSLRKKKSFFCIVSRIDIKEFMSIRYAWYFLK